MPSYSRSFVLKTAHDSAPVPCKWKAGTKKHGPQVAFLETYTDVRHISTISLNEWLLELYQIDELGPDTPLDQVFNIPLIADLLVYPVIIRVTGSQEVPSLGRVKKLLCEYLIENADHSFFPEDEEMEDDVELPSDDDEEEPVPDDEDDESLDEESDDVMEEEDDNVEQDDDEDDEDVLDDDE